MIRSEHSMKLQEPHYTNILEGHKIYETRVNDPKRQAMKVGDIIKISHQNDSTKKGYTIVITERKEFKNFRSAIQSVGISKVLPGVKTLKEGVTLYENFPNYKEGAREYGVVRFGFKVNSNPQEHYLTIQNPKECHCFDLIKSGKKPVEGRKNSPKYQKYQPGDILVLVNDSEHLKTLITKINKYVDVEEYLRTETIQKALPGVKSIQDGIALYNTWSDPKEREALRKKYGYGFLGIHLKVLGESKSKKSTYKKSSQKSKKITQKKSSPKSKKNKKN